MQNKILKAKIYSCFLFFFSLVITTLGIILAASINDQDVKIYGILFMIAGIISSILMFQVFYRLQTISILNAEINNQNCFVSWKVLFGSILNNRDFFFQKYLLSCFIILLFHSMVSFLTRLKYINTSFEFSSNMPISVILFIISFILGLIFQLYLLIQIIQMLADYKEQQKSTIFIIHLKESFEEEKSFKKSITLFSAVFMIFSAIYYLIKLGLYAAIANYTDDTNTKVYSAIMIIQSSFLVFVCTKIFNLLERIYRQIPDQQSAVIYNMNIQCFSGWFTLITSLLFSKKLRFWRNLIYILQFLQTIYGLIRFPFYNIYTVTIHQMYSLESYLYFDSALMLALMGWQFIDTFARVIHSVKRRNITYQFDDGGHNVVVPDGVQVSLEQIARINQNENQLDNFVESADKDFGDCCICLDRISKGQRIYRLKCHMSHVFHYYCMSKWISNHNTCPLCQQTITS